jgi:hypothetical protein
MTDDNKVYTLESRSIEQYRFISLVNSDKGVWRASAESACADGDKYRTTICIKTMKKNNK